MIPNAARPPRFLSAPLGWDKDLASMSRAGAAAERRAVVALEVKGARERFLP